MDKSKKYIIFGSPQIEEDEIAEVVDTLRSGWLGTGPKAKRFEQSISQYIKTKYALAVNSCTAGLHLSLLACGVGPGDEVITTPLTFASTVNSIIHAGATPVFVDVNKETMNLDEEQIEQAITDKTRVIIPVHLAGRPCEMDKISSIAKKNNLFIIEDAAHALGAEYKGVKVGNLGDLACFSFYVTKNITTGEGGMVTTNNKELADKIKVNALHGLSKDAWGRYSDDGYKHYQVVTPGYKYNMTDIQAALGIHQIKKLDKYDKRRQQIWNHYDKNFSDLPLTLPSQVDPGTKHARHLYSILIDKDLAGISRDEFMDELHKRGIGSGVHFRPVHLHQYYREKFGYNKGDYPNAEYIGERTVSLPLSAKLTDEEVQRIIEAVREIILRNTHDKLP